VLLGVRTKFFPRYQEYGLGVGEDDMIRAAERYDVKSLLCGLPAAQGPSTDEESTTIIQLDLKMMLEDGMIWKKSAMSEDGQTIYMSKGCNGAIASYYISRAFYRDKASMDLFCSSCTK
jgi:hypothetical protein